MLEYIQLVLTSAVLVVLLPLIPLSIDYIRLKLTYNRYYKLLINKMNNLILPSLPNSTTPSPNSANTELLSLIAASGQSKKYFGKEFTVKEIESMSPEGQEVLMQRYEAKFGYDVIKTVGNSISSIYAKVLGLATPAHLLGYYVNLTDEQELTDDFNNDPVIQTTLAHQLGKVLCSFGTWLAPFVAMLITAKNLEFNKLQQNKTLVINGGPNTRPDSRHSQGPTANQGPTEGDKTETRTENKES